MSIRKREWVTPAGERKTAWLVDYRDQAGKRRAKQFARKKDAEAYRSRAGWEVSQGTHTADRASITVSKAGDNWLARGRREGLERSTLDMYDQHLRLHIVPFIGARKLGQITRPMIEEFRDQLLDQGRSRAMAKKVLTSLSSILREATRLGHVAHNAGQGITVKRAGRDKARASIPSKDQIRALITAASAPGAKPMHRPLLLTLLFAGLRASEARGLPWRSVDLAGGVIRIEQRADFANVIGPPKSAAGLRSIPIPPLLVAELAKWKAVCPATDLELVFPSSAGKPIFHHNLMLGFQEPVQVAAGVCRPKVRDGKPVLDDAGVPVHEGLFSLHDFRHAAASMWIEQRVAPKRVQTWMGHSSIQITFDTYGHLFEALDADAAVMLAIQADLLPDATPVQHKAA